MTNSTTPPAEFPLSAVVLNALEEFPDLATDGHVRRLVAMARRVEGLRVALGTTAATMRDWAGARTPSPISDVIQCIENVLETDDGTQ